MGYELWTSSLTGHRRAGTRFSELKKIFLDNVTAKFIFERLLSCPASSECNDAREALERRDFDVAGVIETKDAPVIGYVVASELGVGEFKTYIKDISRELLISDSTPLANIFSVLSIQNFVFVLSGNQVIGIVTKADLNKPPVRIYVFGIVSLLEMHLNKWILHYLGDDWANKVPKSRIADAWEIFEQRKGVNQELTLIECVQFCDKRDLLRENNDFLEAFCFSKRRLTSLLSRAERIRNDLAHSQNSIIASMEWPKLTETITGIEAFLIASDHKVERLAQPGASFEDLLM